MPLCLNFVINHSITFRAKKSKRLTWLCSDRLRWFETVFRFSVQLIFRKELLVCVKRLLQLVESRCYNNLSTYSALVLSMTFWLSWQLDRPSNTAYSDIYSIQLQFTQKKWVSECLFVSYQNWLRTMEHISFFFQKISVQEALGQKLLTKLF